MIFNNNNNNNNNNTKFVKRRSVVRRLQRMDSQLAKSIWC